LVWFAGFFEQPVFRLLSYLYVVSRYA
jgi:hypothetical protein